MRIGSNGGWIITGVRYCGYGSEALARGIQKKCWQLGISNRELARRVGYKYHSDINAFLNCEKPIPLRRLMIIADVLQTTPDEFVRLGDSNEDDEKDNANNLRNMINFHKGIRVRRLELGMSQRELGEKMGCDKSYISKLERGERNLRISKMEELARVLGMTMEEMMAKGA